MILLEELRCMKHRGKCLGSGRPESFNVLIKELQGLGLNFQVKNEDGDSILN